MKIRNAFRVLFVVAALAIFAGLAAAQDTSQSTSLGDLARKARADKADSPHASKVVTDEDFGPHLVPIAENEDPADVVNKAHAAIVADKLHTCQREITNNSGPGSTTHVEIEVAGADHVHLVTDTRGGPGPGHNEIIVVGGDQYHRFGSGAWTKDQVSGSLPAPFGGVPEALSNLYSPGAPAQGPWGTSLHFVQRETVNGVPTFLYEDKFHPGGVDTRTQTDDIWVGASDHLPRKAETVLVTNEPHLAPIIQRDSMTCSYGRVPEIKPPM
jgi:hypothetical protein